MVFHVDSTWLTKGITKAKTFLFILGKVGNGVLLSSGVAHVCVFVFLYLFPIGEFSLLSPVDITGSERKSPIGQLLLEQIT